ncbi:hypothetical protein OG601_12075 [Streptomyces sp. NBC_01239]|uniref:hypothetical protein n=1 Tax=Streptomyces sp. NBC_01239 TaxID=2903792 RepID=UPI00224CA158|nr:hypothetical protein [Streptomyces sp. NBC_01239]MCX4811355.1 hypothetical protein [Streptomyces sp. NBC_01239]
MESEITAWGRCSGINGNAGTRGAVTAVVLIGGVLVVVPFSYLIGKVSIMTLDHGLNGHFVPGAVLTLFFVLSRSLQVLLDEEVTVLHQVWRATLEASA